MRAAARARGTERGSLTPRDAARPNDDFWPDADASRLPKTGQKMVAFTGQRLMVDLDGLDADQIDAVLERVTEAAERNGARSAAPLLAAV